MAPAHWGKPHFCSKPCTVSVSDSPVGHLIYLGRSTWTMALHTSFTTRQTVDLEIPKRWLIVRKSEPLDKYHRAIATRCSVWMESLIEVFFFLTSSRTSLHTYTNVSRDILKFNRKLKMSATLFSPTSHCFFPSSTLISQETASSSGPETTSKQIPASHCFAS